jgi:lipoic acid synthetase
MDVALEILGQALPDVFNHNIETVPHHYKAVRPGSDYTHSLELLQKFKQRYPGVPTKSGLMLGLGETNDEIVETLKDMRRYDIDMLTLGQYLQPSKNHLPVKRFVTPAEFDELGRIARELGFTHVASGPMVRSSYHADKQAAGEHVS